MNDINFPVWIDYVKALGTPAVALIAAAIAGSISYRQWATARNKLKLDLFDRRMTIYNDAFKLIEWMATRSFEGAKYEPAKKVADSYASSKWLMGQEVADYLGDLHRRAYEIQEYDDPILAAWSRGEKIDISSNHLQPVREKVQRELEVLDKIFAPYLSLTH